MEGTLVNRIRLLRAAKNMSQADLATATGVSRQAINTIENDRHDPSISLAFRIADALGANITEVFVREDS